MEPFRDTFTVRTREGREFSGLTLASLRTAAAQKIFSMEDSVRSDRVAGTWSPLARVLSLPEPEPVSRGSSDRAPGGTAIAGSEPRASTGIALDLEPSSARSSSASAPAARDPQVNSLPTASWPNPKEGAGDLWHRSVEVFSSRRSVLVLMGMVGLILIIAAGALLCALS